MNDVVKLPYREIWAVDFEFGSPAGNSPEPRCMVAWELKSGRKIRLWQDELEGRSAAPYDVGKDSLFIAYYASAELNCHLALNWALPENVLDLCAEFKNVSNGRDRPCGAGLIGALNYFGLPAISAVEKEEMQKLALRGGTYTVQEKQNLIEYCETDVKALADLLPKMLTHIDLHFALLRGQYMKAAARIETTGVPVNKEVLSAIENNWETIQEKLIQRIDANYGVYEGRSFKAARWEQWLEKNGIPWPRDVKGKLLLDRDTFNDISKLHPAVVPMKELRASLGKFRLSNLSVGKDKRNRAVLWAFDSKTGRNQPSNSEYIFGPAVWIRNLIQPEPGCGIAYIDWEQQEFGIAAALSNDKRMMEAYASGDPYLAFAKQAGAVPKDATKESHKAKRDQFKQCVLAVQYGMGSKSLAMKIAAPLFVAKELLSLHRKTYPTFWNWSDGVSDYAFLNGKLTTTYGWQLAVTAESNPRTIRNFPMQANGAEMLRVACILATELGIRVCAPVHDAILIEAPISDLENAVKMTQAVMAKASNFILRNFTLRTDAKIVRYPDHYSDPRGDVMWKTILSLLQEIEGDKDSR